jgi:hypothetical protein
MLALVSFVVILSALVMTGIRRHVEGFVADVDFNCVAAVRGGECSNTIAVPSYCSGGAVRNMRSICVVTLAKMTDATTVMIAQTSTVSLAVRRLPVALSSGEGPVCGVKINTVRSHAPVFLRLTDIGRGSPADCLPKNTVANALTFMFEDGSDDVLRRRLQRIPANSTMPVPALRSPGDLTSLTLVFCVQVPVGLDTTIMFTVQDPRSQGIASVSVRHQGGQRAQVFFSGADGVAASVYIPAEVPVVVSAVIGVDSWVLCGTELGDIHGYELSVVPSRGSPPVVGGTVSHNPSGADFASVRGTAGVMRRGIPDLVGDFEFEKLVQIAMRPANVPFADCSFARSQYLREQEDVARANVDARYHYDTWGRNEKRYWPSAACAGIDVGSGLVPLDNGRQDLSFIRGSSETECVQACADTPLCRGSYMDAQGGCQLLSSADNFQAKPGARGSLSLKRDSECLLSAFKLRIDLSNNFLHLSEIEVYDKDGTNVALGARVVTSEEEPGRGRTRAWYAGDPSVLTNGRRSFLPAPGIWHSAETYNNYIEVFLPREVAIQAVVIFNRPDCCQDRLVGAVVSLWTRDGLKVWEQRISESKMSYAMFPRSKACM